MKSYNVSITLSIDAASDSEACDEAASTIRESFNDKSIYKLMSVSCAREDLVLTDDPVRYWLEQLPDGYRELALANYAKRKTRSTHDPASVAVAVSVAFVWRNAPEGYTFWNQVWHHYLNCSPLPVLP